MKIAATTVGLMLLLSSCGGSDGGGATAEDLPGKLSSTSLSCGAISAVRDDDFNDDTPGIPDKKIVCSAGDTNAGIWIWDSGDVDTSFVSDVVVDRACRFDVDTSYVSGGDWVAVATRYDPERDANDVDLDVLNEMAEVTGGRVEKPSC